jgi:hypothetical protein
MLIVLFALHAVQAMVEVDEILRQRDVSRGRDRLAEGLSVC